MLRAVLGGAVTGAVAVLLGAAVVLPRLVGATPYVILTGSMRPGLPPGTVVVTRPVPATQIDLGSVITYQLVSGEPTVVTHRVVAEGISADGERVFRTRGDASTGTDPGWVRPVQVRGVRWYEIPYAGRVSMLLDPAQRALLVRGLALGLLGYAGALLIGGLQARRTAVHP